MPQFTQNHMSIDGERDGAVKLVPSDFLLGQVGEPATLVPRPVGERVRAGDVVGRLDGTRQSCHLYAPCDLVIVAHEARGVVAKLEGPFVDTPLDARDYERHLATLAR